MSLQTWGLCKCHYLTPKNFKFLEGFAPTVNKTPVVHLQQSFVSLQFYQPFSEHTSKLLDVRVCGLRTLAAVTVL